MKHLHTVTTVKAAETDDICSFFQKIWKEISTFFKGIFGGGNND